MLKVSAVHQLSGSQGGVRVFDVCPGHLRTLGEDPTYRAAKLSPARGNPDYRCPVSSEPVTIDCCRATCSHCQPNKHLDHAPRTPLANEDRALHTEAGMERMGALKRILSSSGRERHSYGGVSRNLN